MHRAKVAAGRTVKIVCVALLWALALIAGCSSDDAVPSSPAPDAGSDSTTGSSCAAGRTTCGAECVDTQRDPANCGACGKACAAGEACSGGACALQCGGGGTKCGQVCVDTKVDPANCGACGRACASGEVCAAGKCAVTCGALTRCAPDGGAPYCANTQTDNANCGACGATCPSGRTCSGGRCDVTCGALTTCTPDGGAPYCANTQTDNANCGACGSTCLSGTACSGGQCVATCPGGQAMCGVDAGAPYCANTSVDRNNCGSCGNVCGAGRVCSGGACGASCGSGLTTCGSGATSYCANTQSDSANCGTCGTACNLLGVGTQVCVAGTCRALLCSAGNLNCDGIDNTGCECPTSCVGAACRPRRVFLTSRLYSPNFGGLSGADSRCQERAAAAGLPGTFRAWLSDSTGSPSTRFVRSTIPYALVNGTIVANSWNDLVDGNLSAPINVTETGGAPPLTQAGCTQSGVWTATNTNGTVFNGTHCGNWTAADTLVLWGVSYATDGRWTSESSCLGGSNLYCILGQDMFPLYCFEQ